MQKFDVAYFTASCDEADVNKKFAESLKLDYPILSDPNLKAAIAYGVSDGTSKFAKRWTFYIGKDGRILHIDKKINVAKHGEDVAARLEELKIARKENKKDRKSSDS